MQTIRIIVAMAEDRTIGHAGAIPWRLPGDMKRLRKMTTGHILVMGRCTYESIGHALPDRVNIVVSRDLSYILPDATVVHSVDEALAESARYPEKDVFVFGGGEIYRQMLDHADRIDLTLVHGVHGGDTTFPPFEDGYVEMAREAGEGCEYITYERRV